MGLTPAVRNTILNAPKAKLPSGALAEYRMQKANLLKWSEDLSKWTATNITALLNSFRETAANGLHYIQSVSVSISGASSYTYRVRLKPVGRTKGRIYFSAATPKFGVQFDTQALTVTDSINGTGANVSKSIVADGDYFIITVSGSLNSADTSGTAYLMGLDDSGGNSYVGDAAKGFDVAYMQLSLGSSPLPYTRTTDNQSLWNSKLDSLSVANLVSNGNFANGTTGWAVSYGSRIATNNTLIVTHNEVGQNYARVYSTTGVLHAVGKKLYIRAKIRVTNSLCSSISLVVQRGTGGYETSIQAISNPVVNQWYTASGITNITSSDGADNIYAAMKQIYADGATALGKVMEIQEVLAVDIQNLFGVGNEPTQVQCDEMFATWFDGTQAHTLPKMYQDLVYSAENIVQNGNFVGTTGWSGGASSLSATNNILSSTGNGSSQYPNANQNTQTACVTGKKVYVRAKVRVTNSSASSIQLNVNGSTGGSNFLAQLQNTPIANQWYTLSGVVTLAGTHLGNVQVQCNHVYADAATANGKVMEVQECFAVDLTASLGAGNEIATAAKADETFPTWFNGTSQVTYRRGIGLGNLGSTTASTGDANDPTWTGQALSFVTDDYVKFGAMIDPNQDFTVYVVANVQVDNPAASENYFSIGNSGTTTQYLSLYRDTNGGLRAIAYNDAGASGLAELVVGNVTSGIRLLRVQRSGTIVSVKDVVSGKNAEANIPASPISLNQMALGCNLRVSASSYLNQPIYAFAPMQFATTAKQDKEAYRYFKKYLAQWGVAI